MCKKGSHKTHIKTNCHLNCQFIKLETLDELQLGFQFDIIDRFYINKLMANNM